MFENFADFLPDWRDPAWPLHGDRADRGAGHQHGTRSLERILSQ